MKNMVARLSEPCHHGHYAFRTSCIISFPPVPGLCIRCPDADTEAAQAAEVSDRGRPKDPHPTLRTLSVGVQNRVVQHALSVFICGHLWSSVVKRPFSPALPPRSCLLSEGDPHENLILKPLHDLLAGQVRGVDHDRILRADQRPIRPG